MGTDLCGGHCHGFITCERDVNMEFAAGFLLATILTILAPWIFRRFRRPDPMPFLGWSRTADSEQAKMIRKQFLDKM